MTEPEAPRNEDAPSLAAASADAEPVVHPLAPDPTPAEPKRSDLPARLATAAVLVPAVLAIIIAGGLWVLGTVIIVTLLVSALAGFTPAVFATTQETGVVMVPNNFSQLAKDAKPSVVNIRTVTTIKGGGRVFKHFFGGPPNGQKNPFEEFWGPFQDNQPQRDFKQRSLGSGFIIDKDGYIVTNNHVIEDADEIQVKLRNGDEYDAEIVGRDPNTDLALIKTKSGKNFPFVSLGDSDALKIGQWVVAIGNYIP